MDKKDDVKKNKDAEDFQMLANMDWATPTSTTTSNQQTKTFEACVNDKWSPPEAKNDFFIPEIQEIKTNKKSSKSVKYDDFEPIEFEEFNPEEAAAAAALAASKNDKVFTAPAKAKIKSAKPVEEKSAKPTEVKSNKLNEAETTIRKSVKQTKEDTFVKSEIINKRNSMENVVALRQRFETMENKHEALVVNGGYFNNNNNIVNNEGNSNIKNLAYNFNNNSGVNDVNEDSIHQEDNDTNYYEYHHKTKDLNQSNDAIYSNEAIYSNDANYRDDINYNAEATNDSLPAPDTVAKAKESIWENIDLKSSYSSRENSKSLQNGLHQTSTHASRSSVSPLSPIATQSPLSQPRHKQSGLKGVKGFSSSAINTAPKPFTPPQSTLPPPSAFQPSPSVSPIQSPPSPPSPGRANFGEKVNLAKT